MSCRTTSPGSLATTYAKQRTSLTDGQITSLFHELRRREIPSREQVNTSYQGFLQEVKDYIDIQGATWTVRKKEKALERYTRALQDQSATEQDKCSAVDLLRRAQQAERALETEFSYAASVQNLTTDQIREEFKRIYKETNELSFSNTITRYQPPVPGDWRTAYALQVITFSRKLCPSCGQFIPFNNPAPIVGGRIPQGYEFQYVTHACPNASSLTVNEPPRELGWENNMDAFQQVYDKVREKIVSGQRRVPVYESLTSVVGGVTSGIAHPDGGVTFGLELEFDFPDDEWPYRARSEFAEILYSEGISLEPTANRWHFVGDAGADRPGGSFFQSPYGWSVERDSSVDGMNGERGVEIKSQILYDEPATWRNIQRICAVAEELGGAATPRCGLHVNLGVEGFPPDDPTPHTRLIRLLSSYDDTIVRMSHNPESGEFHRGRGYCHPVSEPPDGFTSVDHIRGYANHYDIVNFNNAPSLTNPQTRTSRIELRVFDGTLDPGRIQAQTMLSLGLLNAAKKGVEPRQGVEYAGSHRNMFGTRRLSGDQWENATRSFRQLTDILSGQGLNKPEQVEMLTWLFAVTRWQRN